MNDPTIPALQAVKIIGALRNAFPFLSRAEKRKLEARRFKHLYVPLYNLFLARHVTVCTAPRAPHFRDRLRNAIDVFYRTKKPMVAVKKACRALFDKQISPSVEIEFGGDFPNRKILSIAQDNAECADQKLLVLIARADRARFEEMPGYGEMTQADFELYEHICNERASLSNKYA
jgi:hypothetical protein